MEGRFIEDNILLAHEAFHALKKKKKGRNGFMALKLDLVKAFNRVDWLEKQAPLTGKKRNPYQGSCYNSSLIYYVVFLLPSTICNKLNAMIGRFWWSSSEDKAAWSASSFSCSLVDEGTSINPIEVWLEVDSKVNEYLKAFVLPSVQVSPSLTSPMDWIPPPESTVKINCDAPFTHITKEACIDVVLWDSLGIIIGGTSKSVFANYVYVVEVLACKLGVVTAI
ncbi:hypothetical protein V6N13_036545 [Hibiscus sabdariffa]